MDDIFGSRLTTEFASLAAVEEAVLQTGLVVGAVLIPGAAAPKLIKRAQLSQMKPGAVIVDAAIDQGGCFETYKATTHADPTYVVDGIVSYGVANMPGGVARNSTFALNNATPPFTLALANKAWRQVCIDEIHLLKGLNIHAGQITYPAVASALGKAAAAVETVLR